MNSNHSDNNEEKSQAGAEGVDPRDKALAKLSVLLDKPEVTDSEKPTTAEIWDWMNEALGDTRALQVQAHVARDPLVYAQWRELREIAQECESIPIVPQVDVDVNPNENLDKPAVVVPVAPSGISHWIGRLLQSLQPQSFVGLALGSILGFAVAIGIMQTQPQPQGQSQLDMWDGWSSPKSFLIDDEPLQDLEEVQAVLSGIAAQMSELSLPALGPNGEKLPRKMPECVGDSHGQNCGSRRQMLHYLGKLAIRTRVLCLSTIDMPQDVMDGIKSIQTKIKTDDAAGRFIGSVDKWVSGDSQKSQCRAVKQVISSALLGLDS